MSCGSSSLKTPHSRISRAMSWLYCPPKSSTRTSSCRWSAGPVAAGPPILRATASSSDGAPRGATRGSASAVLRSGTWIRAASFSVEGAGPSVIRDGDPDVDGGATVRTHADRLLALQLLALGHQCRGDHHLGAV